MLLQLIYFKIYTYQIKIPIFEFNFFFKICGLNVYTISSRYDYIYLIHEKSKSLDVFKKFEAEVENQLSKIIKNIRSDRGGEYYGRYDGSGE